MERKECESIGCYTHFVTFNCDLNHDLDLGFSRSNFEQGKSEGFDSCDRPSNLTQIGFKSFIFHPV